MKFGYVGRRYVHVMTANNNQVINNPTPPQVNPAHASIHTIVGGVNAEPRAKWQCRDA
jgi:hypothetical protein